MDKEFAEAFKEEIELDEMKWAVGGVYHQAVSYTHLTLPTKA